MRARVLGSLFMGFVAACTVSNTGNPHNGSHPEGIELVRSQLERDTEPQINGDDGLQFASDQRALAFDLFRQLGADDANAFISPYSIATALAMTYAGSEAQTKAEMATALRFSLPESTLHAAFNSLDLALARRSSELAEMAKGDPFQLETMNATFIERSEPVQSEFLDVLALNYDAGAFLADFVNQPERERTAINGWVSDQTKQRIEDLLPNSSITSNTRLVLVNTIYFKGSWLIKFDPKNTAEAVFHASTGDVSVKMMHSTVRRRYARGSDYQAVELPYVSPSVRMLVVLPDEGKLAAVQAKLQTGLFDEARAGQRESMVELSMPRFTFRSELKLKPSLEALGMSSAFGSMADFSKIAGPPGYLFIDDVYHQAVVAVDEAGTEAAASTAVVFTTRSGVEYVTLTLDRPFLFFIYDEPTGQILFEGRLSQPE